MEARIQLLSTNVVFPCLSFKPEGMPSPTHAFSSCLSHPLLCVSHPWGLLLQRGVLPPSQSVCNSSISLVLEIGKLFILIMFNCGQPWLPHVTPYPNAEYAEALLTLDIRDARSLIELLRMQPVIFCTKHMSSTDS